MYIYIYIYIYCNILWWVKWICDDVHFWSRLLGARWTGSTWWSRLLPTRGHLSVPTFSWNNPVSAGTVSGSSWQSGKYKWLIFPDCRIYCLCLACCSSKFVFLVIAFLLKYKSEIKSFDHMLKLEQILTSAPVQIYGMKEEKTGGK